MKVSIKVGPKAVVEAEGETVKQVFERVAELAEVFACGDKCGACQSPEVVPRVREAQGYTFYELACLACGARLQFGQTKEGERLFPKRRSESGQDKPNGGWEKYQGPPQGHAAPSNRPRSSSRADDPY